MIKASYRKQCSLSIPPSFPSTIAAPITLAGDHGSSRSLNLLNYKTVMQFPSQNETQSNVYPINAYTGELDYSVATKSSIRDLHNTVQTPKLERSVQSRQNSIITAQDPRFSAYGYSHTVHLNNTQPETDDVFQARDVSLYCKLAWFSCLFFLPVGIIALMKFYESKKLRHKNPERAEAASDMSRFIGTFAVLLGVITYMLILAVRLRISYEKGESFI